MPTRTERVGSALKAPATRTLHAHPRLPITLLLPSPKPMPSVYAKLMPHGLYDPPRAPNLSSPLFAPPRYICPSLPIPLCPCGHTLATLLPLFSYALSDFVQRSNPQRSSHPAHVYPIYTVADPTSIPRSPQEVHHTRHISWDLTPTSNRPQTDLKHTKLSCHTSITHPRCFSGCILTPHLPHSQTR